MPSVITLKSTDGLAVGNVPARNFFLARVSVCITVGVFVGGWFFLFATELATEMGFTDDWFTDGALPSVNPSVLFSPTDFIAFTDGINPSVKLDNVVVISTFNTRFVGSGNCFYFLFSMNLSRSHDLDRGFNELT
jgi:hypothetical protein